MTKAKRAKKTTTKPLEKNKINTVKGARTTAQPVDLKPVDKNTLRSDETRRRVIGAAVEIFAAKGFAGSTTRDIAQAANMSPTVLYVHYKSKEDVLFLLCTEGHALIHDVVREAAASSDDPVAQLQAVMRAFAAYHARRHASARVVSYEIGALTPEHRAAITEYRSAIDNEVRRIIDAGVAEGVFTTKNPHMTCTALLSLGIDIARWYREEGAWTPEEIADHYGELALRMVGATA